MRLGLYVSDDNVNGFCAFFYVVNTASRIERSGVGNRVHLSENTANLIIGAGKESWVEPRSDVVHLKGIGSVKTFWLVGSKANSKAGSVADYSDHSGIGGNDWARHLIKGGADGTSLKDQTARLVAWNTESLLRLLQQVAASRGGPPKKGSSKRVKKLMPKAAPLNEVAEIISLPAFSSKKTGKRISPEAIEFGPDVKQQLYSYVSWVASAYKENPFHNFEHASHVSMSVNKLLSRIVAPEISVEDVDENKAETVMAAQLHE